ncbi:MAG: hypothetical protein ACK55Z_02735, partial [bacterium]
RHRGGGGRGGGVHRRGVGAAGRALVARGVGHAHGVADGLGMDQRAGVGVGPARAADSRGAKEGAAVEDADGLTRHQPRAQRAAEHQAGVVGHAAVGHRTGDDAHVVSDRRH